MGKSRIIRLAFGRVFGRGIGRVSKWDRVVQARVNRERAARRREARYEELERDIAQSEAEALTRREQYEELQRQFDNIERSSRRVLEDEPSALDRAIDRVFNGPRTPAEAHASAVRFASNIDQHFDFQFPGVTSYDVVNSEQTTRFRAPITFRRPRLRDPILQGAIARSRGGDPRTREARKAQALVDIPRERQRANRFAFRKGYFHLVI